MLRRSAVLLVASLLLSTPGRSGGSESATPGPEGEPSPEAILAEVPFLPSDEPNRIIIDLAPDGYAPFRMMLDTGAADSVLTPRYAEKLKVIVRREQDRPTAGRLGWVATFSSGWIPAVATPHRRQVLSMAFWGVRFCGSTSSRSISPESASAS